MQEEVLFLHRVCLYQWLCVFIREVKASEVNIFDGYFFLTGAFRHIKLPLGSFSHSRGAKILGVTCIAGNYSQF